MKLKSLGYRSDLIFTRFDGESSDRGSYLVVKTTSNPTYFWGNLLIFDRPPQRGDLREWRRLFKEEFKDPQTYHLTFAWDCPDEGDLSEFLENGFRFEKGVALTARKVHLPSKNHSSLVVRPLSTDEDWENSIQVQLTCGNETLTKEQWENFDRTQASRYRKMVDAGLGFWFGGFLGSKMVASLGIFRDGDVGRYQIVSTHAEFRRQGICGSLVYQSAQYAFEKMGLKTLVMVADENYHAAKIYESVGFVASEKMLGVCWWDKTRG